VIIKYLPYLNAMSGNQATDSVLFQQVVSAGQSDWEVTQANQDASQLQAGVEAYQRARGCISLAEYEAEFDEALAYFLTRVSEPGLVYPIEPASVIITELQEPPTDPSFALLSIGLPLTRLSVPSSIPGAPPIVFAYYRPEVYSQDVRLFRGCGCDPCFPNCDALIVQHRFFIIRPVIENLDEVQAPRPRQDFGHQGRSLQACAGAAANDYPFLSPCKCTGACLVVPQAPVAPIGATFFDFSRSFYVGRIVIKGCEDILFRSLYLADLLVYASTNVLGALPFAEAGQVLIVEAVDAEIYAPKYCPHGGRVTFTRQQDIRANFVTSASGQAPLTFTQFFPVLSTDGNTVYSIFTQGVAVTL